MRRFPPLSKVAWGRGGRWGDGEIGRQGDNLQFLTLNSSLLTAHCSLLTAHCSLFAMRRDSIFYKLFQQYPPLLFELLTNPPENASEYTFDSKAVKETKFEIDGVLVPPENQSPGAVYFVAVQFQTDEMLYERMLAESYLYFYRNRRKFSDLQMVVIYPSRNTEQSDIYPHRTLLSGEQFHRIYLDELGNIRELPVEVAVMLLTTVKEEQALL